MKKATSSHGERSETEGKNRQKRRWRRFRGSPRDKMPKGWDAK